MPEMQNESGHEDRVVRESEEDRLHRLALMAIQMAMPTPPGGRRREDREDLDRRLAYYVD